MRTPFWRVFGSRRRWAGRCAYSLAIVAVALGFVLRLALTAWVGPGLPTYITFYPAVMAVALLEGIGPGLAATALTDLVATYSASAADRTVRRRIPRRPPGAGGFQLDGPVH